ncbi:pyridoxamine 5'-phosphate oxidase family protein [Reichenbachiella versicolor]|uniref:pyridoxamine 5'-phosphate oxidase family protein n=1 Tax=Reichenbachiella versicolor TaxID=1821036 RepID=UPI000D6E7E38|nr:pyridoxamine 5'-phosphate oxidase family protein [Reichenbachiella versicolor]
MSHFEKTTLNKVIRGAKRATYDKKTVFEILDAGIICHLSYEINGTPFVIPTAYGRVEDTIYVHGSMKSRSLISSLEIPKVCICVTLLDGLVLARSAFHHSANYRSVMVFGGARHVESDEEKNQALYAITENVLQGRWDEVREPNQKELDATKVLAIKIESASAKIRTGAPVDETEDYELDVWAGELPFKSGFDTPISDEKLKNQLEVSPSVRLACSYLK